MHRMHKLIAALGAALVAVGHHIPGPVGWVLMGTGVFATTATEGSQVFAARSSKAEP